MEIITAPPKGVVIPFDKRKGLKKVTLVFFQSTDDGATWLPVLIDEVPAWCKESRIILAMLNGEMCQREDDQPWYRAEKAVMH